MDISIEPGLVEILDSALANGLKIKSKSVTKTSDVQIGWPEDFPEANKEQLKGKAPEVRLLWRVRALAEWLNGEYEQWQHGESVIEGDAYGEWIDLFVSGDKVLRFVYDFEGCIWGAKGCNEASPTGYAPVLCEGCVNGK